MEESPNNPPFTTGNPGAQEAVEGVRFSLALATYFGDIDADDSLQFSAGGLPGGLGINRDSGLLSGTPRASDARDAPYSVTITATDPGGLSASLSFMLRVFPDRRSDLKVTAEVAVNPVSVGESAQWSIAVENLGPSNLDEGELIANWVTSGANLSLDSSARLQPDRQQFAEPFVPLRTWRSCGEFNIDFRHTGSPGQRWRLLHDCRCPV